MASGSNSPSVGGTKIFFNQPTINSEFVIRIYKKLDEICKSLVSCYILPASMAGLQK